ncbi:ribosome silencing factor [Desulfuribacillus stibiiarsenatis]|uniref:Ribosomal silencing factor RsfS n=1 Tax=Desulfuribacillus stibiiarsenatis TaxID=1390249 RepID=A0A1E5L405_9FIRM|nr:ribosome silencing factor [Desulfuribacillus stibiiarsenatis]
MKKEKNLDLIKRIVYLIEDKKAEDIVILDIEGLSVISDYFVICTGRSVTQVKAIADHVMDTLKQEDGIMTRGVEGQREGKWVLVDFGDVIIHVFRQEEREFYNLERLWGDAKLIPVDQVSTN